MRKSRLCKAGGMLGVLFLAACSHAPAADPAGSLSAQQPCTAQIIVSFSGIGQVPPDENAVQTVARASRSKLTYVRSITPDLHVFGVSSGGPDPG